MLRRAALRFTRQRLTRYAFIVIAVLACVCIPSASAAKTKLWGYEITRSAPDPSVATLKNLKRHGVNVIVADPVQLNARRIAKDRAAARAAGLRFVVLTRGVRGLAAFCGTGCGVLISSPAVAMAFASAHPSLLTVIRLSTPGSLKTLLGFHKGSLLVLIHVGTSFDKGAWANALKEAASNPSLGLAISPSGSSTAVNQVTTSFLTTLNDVVPSTAPPTPPTSPLPPPPPPPVPGQPTNLHTTQVNPLTATIAWDAPAGGADHYDILLNGVPVSSTTLTTVTLTTLVCGIATTIGVDAANASGGHSAAVTISVTPPCGGGGGGGGAPADTTSPTVAMTAPANNSVADLTIAVSATASDNVGVVGVQFKLDGANLGAEDTTAPYGISFDTTTASDGPHTITAVARDAAGNVTTSAGVTIRIGNVAPTVSSITRVGSALTNALSVQYTVTFSEPVSGVTTSSFALTSTVAGPSVTGVSGTGPYTVTVNTGAGDGTLRLDLPSSATGITDADGNAPSAGFTTGQSFTVDKTAPTIVLTAPAAGGVTGTVTVSGSAADANLSTTQFKLDGANLGAAQSGTAPQISWDTTAVADGAHTLTAVTTDLAGNSHTSAGVVVIVGNHPPSVSSITRVSSSPNHLSSLDFTVTFSEPVTGVTAGAFGVTATGTAAGSVTGISGSGASYTVTVSSITGNGTIRLDLTTFAGIADVDNNALTGLFTAGQTYTIDTTAPTVSLTAPAAAAKVHGSSVAVSATAADVASGVATTQFKLDGVNLGSAQAGTSPSVAWDTTGASDGSHTLTAVTTDVAGNSTTSAGVTVTVDNTAPTISVGAPAANAKVRGTTVTVSGTAGDAGTGVSSTQFKLDGINLGSAQAGTSPSITWNTTGASDGSHTLTAVTTDVAGNSTTSAGVTVTVDNTAPTISVSAPAAAAKVRGTTVTVSGTAADATSGVSSTQFKLDGVNLGSAQAGTSPSVTWDTTGASDGSHTLTAVTTDLCGNTTISHV